VACAVTAAAAAAAAPTQAISISKISANTSSATKNNYLHQKHSTIQNLPISKRTLANLLH
jgi:hypothetical protein